VVEWLKVKALSSNISTAKKKKKKNEKWCCWHSLAIPDVINFVLFFTWSLSPLLFPSFQSPGLQTSSNLGLWYQRMVLLRQITVPFVIYIYILWNIFIEFYENRRMRWVMPVILATQEERSGGLWFKATSQSFIYIYIYFFFFEVLGIIPRAWYVLDKWSALSYAPSPCFFKKTYQYIIFVQGDTL
jgi:hypothetical protein